MSQQLYLDVSFQRRENPNAVYTPAPGLKIYIGISVTRKRISLVRPLRVETGLVLFPEAAVEVIDACSTLRSLLESWVHGEQGRGCAGSGGERQERGFCRALHTLQLG